MINIIIFKQKMWLKKEVNDVIYSIDYYNEIQLLILKLG